MLLTFGTVDQIDYVSGFVQLMKFTPEDQDPYWVVRVEQYCKNLEYIKVLSLPDARSTFLLKCNEYKKRLSFGRPYIEFQLAERDDGLWEFRSDGQLPRDFYASEVRGADASRKTFVTRDDAIEFGRTCSGRWQVSIHGKYNILDRSGKVTTARSLKHIDWDNIPSPAL